MTGASSNAGSPVLLHIGMPKTGSSALQSVFVRNRSALANQGVIYPAGRRDEDAARGEVTSGNGGALRRALGTHESTFTTRQTFTDLARRVEEADGRTLLYSQETIFGSFQKGRLIELRDRIDAAGGQLKLVVYVRDISGHACSAYSQFIKGRLYAEPFSSFIAPGDAPPADGNSAGTLGYRPRLRQRLQVLLDIAGADNLIVRHYDSGRNNLGEDFLRHVLGFGDLAQFDTQPLQVNRSLTMYENEMMRYINPSLESRAQARRISDALITLPPLGARGVMITESDLGVLHRRFDSDVEWVNRQFFPDARLKVHTSSVSVGEPTTSREHLSEGERHLLDGFVALTRAQQRRAARKRQPAPRALSRHLLPAARRVAARLRRTGWQRR